MDPHSPSIVDIVESIRSGRSTVTAVLMDCLDRIHAQEPVVRAWSCLNEAHALEQARRLDEAAGRGEANGALYGVPVGIKDIVDTAGMSTEYGCPVFSGRVPSADARLIERLREAGAIVLGKTVTAEMATFAPGPTTNPHDPARTPGGSSSGSAAAVASMMVPGTIGSQTNGSMIRPASFCGVYGFKPTYGLIPRHGVLKQSPFLDQMGVFARSLADVAVLAETLIGAHPDDPATGAASPGPPLSRIIRERPARAPTFGFVRTAAWTQAEASTRRELEALVARLGDRAFEVTLPGVFDSVWDQHRVINEADIAAHYGPYFEHCMDHISESLRGQIERGATVRVVDYLQAQALRETLNTHLSGVFGRCDVLITPAAPGEAPADLSITGNPVFCTTWTLAGVPALSLPLLEGPAGLPVGVQLVGARRDDARLLRSARWLESSLERR